MKIGFLFPDSQFASWGQTHGVVSTLQAMGHEVVTGAMPNAMGEIPPHVFEQIKSRLPSLETLKGCDAILISGPEHLAPWFDAVYGKYDWKGIDVPKAAWWHESMHREDYTLDWDNVGFWANENFVPAYQDADWLSQECFGGQHVHWLPFGVDTKVFHDRSADVHGWDLPTNVASHTEKKYPVAFIGLMYEKRQNFLKALQQHNIPRIRIGNVVVRDLDGADPVENVERLASNYRRVGVFFNLPALSRLLVSKVYEAMACGTFLYTPMLGSDKGISENMKPFHDREHLVYYRGANLVDVARGLREWSSEDKTAEREKIAAAGCREVHEKHSLKLRLETILSKIGVRETVAK